MIDFLKFSEELNAFAKLNKFRLDCSIMESKIIESVLDMSNRGFKSTTEIIKIIRLVDQYLAQRNLKITHLNLSGNKLKTEDITSIVRARSLFEGLSNITTLKLANNEIGPEAVKAIVNTFPNLTELDFFNNKIGPQGAINLSKTLPLTLNILILAKNGIGNGVKAIVKGLSSIPSSPLTTLNLANNNIQTEDAKFIANELEKLSSLTFLDLSNNPINDEGVQAIVHCAKFSRSIKMLSLANNNIQKEGVKAIARMVMTPELALETLDLSANKIKDDGALLAVALLINELTFLNLSNNEINTGAKPFAKVLHLSYRKDTTIDLTNNDLFQKGDGPKYFAQMLPGTEKYTRAILVNKRMTELKNNKKAFCEVTWSNAKDRLKY